VLKISGTHAEAMYSLMTYGIPHDSIPISDSGEIKRKTHLEMLRLRETLEDYAKTGSTVEMVEIPQKADFLLGKGRPFQEHQGNLRVHSIVDEELHRYDACSRKEKTELSAEVLQMVKAYSGRFLTQESGVWIEIQDEVAHKKICNLFRNRRKTMVKKIDELQKVVEANARATDRMRESPDFTEPLGEDSAKRAKVV